MGLRLVELNECKLLHQAQHKHTRTVRSDHHKLDSASQFMDLQTHNLVYELKMIYSMLTQN
mgnify:CR=1 FL=1